jgi:hypothetical protein
MGVESVKKLGLAMLLAGAMAAPAAAAIVDFDDLSGMAVLTGSYGGINWGGSWRHYDMVQAPYTPASGTQRIYRNYSVWGVGDADIPFTFASDVVFTGAFISGYASNPVTFLLFNNGGLVHTSAAQTPSATPVFAASGYTGLVDEVRVRGRQIVTLDNISYLLSGSSGDGGNDEPLGPGVPEPASWAMLIAGFGLIGAMMRRRRLGMTGSA